MIRFYQALLSIALLTLTVGTVGCDRGGDDSQSSTSTRASENDDGDRADWPDEVVFAFQPQENPGSIRPDAEKIKTYMAEKLGVATDISLPTSYATVVEALRGGHADVAYFSGWPYLIADQKVGMDLLVVEERHGKPYYHSQIYVAKESDIQSLADLKGKSMAFTSATSTCGYLFPMAEFIEKTDLTRGADPKEYFSEVLYAGGYQQSLESLLRERVDAAAASDYAPELYLSEEERDSIRVISKQGPVPTHGVAVRSALPDKLKKRIKEAFLGLNDGEHADLLKSLYGAEKLVERTHEEHVGAMANALEITGEERDIDGFGAGSGSGHGSGMESEESGAGKGSGSGSGSEHGSGSGSGHEHGSGSGHSHD